MSEQEKINNLIFILGQAMGLLSRVQHIALDPVSVLTDEERLKSIADAAGDTLSIQEVLDVILQGDQ